MESLFFYVLKISCFSIFLAFSDMKKLNSETRKCVIEKILLGLNKAYMKQARRVVTSWAQINHFNGFMHNPDGFL